jgi:hypothetical protein
MFFKNMLTFAVLSVGLYANPLKLTYSYGVHDFVVDDEFHTFGINAGLYVDYTGYNGINQSGFFEAFVDYDKEELDPDHIPVWFRANYEVDKVLFNINDNFDIEGVFDFDWKMNTVSSIEQYLKSGVGIGFDYHPSSLSFGLKVLGGTYYLELDDDVPEENGYNRDELGGEFKGAYAYAATVGNQFSKDMFAQLEYSEWYDSDEWLEKYLALKINYSTILWDKDTSIQFSLESTTYNLSSLNKGEVAILPWDDDMLLKLSVHIPF